MKATYGEDTPSYAIAKYWHCGQTSVEMASFPGRGQSAIDENTVRQVEAAILEDCCID